MTKLELAYAEACIAEVEARMAHDAAAEKWRLDRRAKGLASAWGVAFDEHMHPCMVAWRKAQDATDLAKAALDAEFAAANS